MPHIQSVLDEPPGAYALLSSCPETDTAFVLVHGFWGDSVSTWQQFQVLMDQWPLYERSDAYFFDYRAEGNYIGRSAASLKAFLAALYPQPPIRFFEERLEGVGWAADVKAKKLTIRDEPYHYKRLVLVGHSLGGLVIRKLIIDEMRRSRDEPATGTASASVPYPILSADLRLILPAHLGFRPGGPLRALFSLPIGQVLRVVLSAYRAFTELSPDSALIKAVKSETESYAANDPHCALPALRAKILWADYEDVVVAGEYACDAAPQYPLRKTTHIDVVKPTPDYLVPMGFLIEEARSHGQS